MICLRALLTALFLFKFNFKVRFYDLRYTHATLLLKQGIHPKTVSKHFSYKDMFITLNRYSHVFPRIQGVLLKYVVKDHSNSNIYKYKNTVSPLKRNRNISMLLLYFKLARIQIKIKPSIFHERFMIPSF